MLGREKGKVRGRTGERGKAITPNRYVGYTLRLLYYTNDGDVDGLSG